MSRELPPARRAGWGLSVVAVLALVVGGVAMGGCITRPQTIEQRATTGPTSEQMLNMKVMLAAGREPTFEEKRQWEAQVEEKIGTYLRQHPDKANALDVSQFRFYRQAAVGMDKEQIMILLGPPVRVTGDQGQMEKIARGYWAAVRGNATEAWVYPLGWNLFFAGQNLIDITQYLPAQ